MTFSPSARIRRIAAGAAGAALVLDYAIRVLLLALRLNGLRLVPGLLDLHYAWNYGVSFSLLWQSSDRGAVMLAVFQLAIIALLAVGAWRAQRTLVGAGLGLIIGGALANVIDRGLHDAVFDYLYVHLGGLPLFVCNTPDVAISAGVLCLLVDMLLTRRAGHRTTP